MDNTELRFQELIEKQNGGVYTKVLTAGELFESGENNNHRISGIQFSTFPATISIAETKDRKGKIINCVPIQKGTADTDIVVYDNTYVFGHSFGYTKFQCDVPCTVNLISKNL